MRQLPGQLRVVGPTPVALGPLDQEILSWFARTRSPRSLRCGSRVERSLRVVINSVIFRSSGQDLTTTGTYTEMTSRLAEPVLLGLAVLAIRNRVKR